MELSCRPCPLTLSKAIHYSEWRPTLDDAHPFKRQQSITPLPPKVPLPPQSPLLIASNDRIVFLRRTHGLSRTRQAHLIFACFPHFCPPHSQTLQSPTINPVSLPMLPPVFVSHIRHRSDGSSSPAESDGYPRTTSCGRFKIHLGPTHPTI